MYICISIYRRYYYHNFPPPPPKTTVISSADTFSFPFKALIPIPQIYIFLFQKYRSRWNSQGKKFTWKYNYSWFFRRAPIRETLVCSKWKRSEKSSQTEPVYTKVPETCNIYFSIIELRTLLGCNKARCGYWVHEYTFFFLCCSYSIKKAKGLWTIALCSRLTKSNFLKVV